MGGAEDGAISKSPSLGCRRRNKARSAAMLSLKTGGARLRRALTFGTTRIPGLEVASPHRGADIFKRREGTNGRHCHVEVPLSYFVGE